MEKDFVTSGFENTMNTVNKAAGLISSWGSSVYENSYEARTGFLRHVVGMLGLRKIKMRGSFGRALRLA